ncbi:sugar kinase [Glycomyces sp. L485]|uniref:sugar kinase n=1 Tax=Glycomyces sp. L485 TaxID=2909235 RepID=UPI001F4BC0C5|nr:sugar kinase [Glycomyces sp. L485]MCH7230374.1 sugar kinase [Glycomyces sp. L485]
MEVLCLGESMVVLAPTAAASLRHAADLRAGVAGAESNVAISLALLGVHAGWRGKVGDDPFGRRILDVLRASDVDCDGVEVEVDHPTGIYFKDPSPEGTKVHYYRAGSAASTMAPGLLTDVEPPRLLHLSGITPALSDGCAELIRELVIDRALAPAEVSFDVNYRPALWPVEVAAPVLAPLADAADLTFVGLDEAETLWGCKSADEVRERLPGVETLVVKDGGIGVTCFQGDRRFYSPAEPVEVIEPVGAGDAFASGFLHGRLKGASPDGCMRLGHRLAAGALQTIGDLAAPPPPQTVKSILEQQI